MIRKMICGIAAVVMLGGTTLAVNAHPTAEDAYDYRKSVMTSLRGHIGAASMIVRGLIADNGYLLHHADGLANGVAEVHRLFQEGSVIEGSEALPSIWDEPEKFAAAIEKSVTATTEFRKIVAAGGDKEAISMAFRNVGMSCRGCHDDFRAQHDH